MDAIALLTADHNRVRGLFARYQKAHEGDNGAAMTTLAAKIVDELRIHTTIEEELFYPWTHDLSDEIGEMVDEGIQEHHVVKVLIGEIAQLEPGDDAWLAKMTVLMENVEHHADEEEKDMFPKIRSHSGAAARADLGAQLDARKGQLGAPVLADTIDLTDARLHELASEQDIPGRSAMAHDELAATVDPG